MHSATIESTLFVHGQPTKCPIVHALNPANPNESALEWAAAQAVRARSDLVVIAAAGTYFGSSPSVTPETDLLQSELTRICATVRRQHPDLEVVTELWPGDPVDVVLDASPGASMFVLGARPHGPVERVAVGSTSIAVAGRATVPTIIVPIGSQSIRPDAHVVVGVDPLHDNARALRFGFERARELQVPMIALNVWDVHPAALVRADDRRRWHNGILRGVEYQLDAIRPDYPGVEAHAAERRDTPAGGLLDASFDTQLLVLGRHTNGSRFRGFPIDSVARAVLHRGVGPVAVVPGN